MRIRTVKNRKSTVVDQNRAAAWYARNASTDETSHLPGHAVGEEMSMSRVTMIGTKIQLDFYKQTEGFDEEKTSLNDCCAIAEKYGMSRADAEKRLRTDGGEIQFEKIRMWSEEAMHYSK